MSLIPFIQLVWINWTVSLCYTALWKQTFRRLIIDSVNCKCSYVKNKSKKACDGIKHIFRVWINLFIRPLNSDQSPFIDCRPRYFLFYLFLCIFSRWSGRSVQYGIHLFIVPWCVLLEVDYIVCLIFPFLWYVHGPSRQLYSRTWIPFLVHVLKTTQNFIVFIRAFGHDLGDNWMLETAELLQYGFQVAWACN